MSTGRPWTWTGNDAQTCKTGGIPTKQRARALIGEAPRSPNNWKTRTWTATPIAEPAANRRDDPEQRRPRTKHPLSETHPDCDKPEHPPKDKANAPKRPAAPKFKRCATKRKTDKYHLRTYANPQPVRASEQKNPPSSLIPTHSSMNGRNST